MSYGSKVQRFAYNRSPYFLKCLASSYYGWASFSKKYGKFYESYSDELNTSQWLSTQELLDLQKERILKFIQYAYRNVPYYSELFEANGLTPSDIQCLDDIQKLPILTKEVLRRNSEDLLSRELNHRDLVWVHTSGTTGKALEIALSKECFQREYAFNWLHRSWAAVDKASDRIATFAGHPVVPIDKMKRPFWVYNFHEKQLVFSSYHLSRANLPYYAEKLDRFRPDLIHGYPSSIYLVADYLLKQKIDTIRPKCVVTASETIFRHQRRTIEGAFDCRLLMWYGNTEMCANIVECPHGGLHVKHEHSYVEFLDEDNQPVKPGCSGKMICTGFGNYATPLIRYEVGDVAVPIDEECSCGRGGHLVKEVVGRVEDYIVTPDGRFVGRLDHIFKEALNVQEAQLIQETLCELTIRIVRRPEYSQENEAFIKNEAHNRLGNSIKVKINYVDSIPRMSSGKLRFIISKINLDEFKIPEMNQ